GDRQAIGTGGNCNDASANPALDVLQTWQYGTLQTSKYASMPWYRVDLDLDANTGLPTRSRDSAEVPVDLTFDRMGRLTKFIPKSMTGIAADASTIYTWPTLSNPDTL